MDIHSNVKYNDEVKRFLDIVLGHAKRRESTKESFYWYRKVIASNGEDLA